MAQSHYQKLKAFTDTLEGMPLEVLSEKIKAARIGAFSYVRLREDTSVPSITEAIDDGTAQCMNRLYQDIAGVDWTELIAARYSEKFYRWTVTHGIGYRWQDCLLGGDGSGAVERKLKDAGLFIR